MSMDSQLFEIVCIDDEPLMLEVYADLVEQTGYKAVTFESPLEAVDYIKVHSRKVSLIICDYSMPDLNGVELRERIFSEVERIPFALVSAHLSMKNIAVEIREKITEFHEKPFDPAKLLGLIRRSYDIRLTAHEEEKELIGSFVAEASPKLDEIDELLLSLESYSSQKGKEIIQAISRHMHTIKGAASCIGLSDVAGLAHDFEDAMVPIARGEKSLTSAQITIFLMVCDQMRDLFAQSKAGITPTYNAIYWQDILSGRTQPPVTEVEGAKDQVSKTNKISISTQVIEEFLESSGNLVVLRNYLLGKVEVISERYPGDKDIGAIKDFLLEMQRENSLIQVKANELKKISFGDIIRPLRKMVRSTSFKLQKRVRIEVEGEDLKIDYNIAKVLADVLVHMIRNSLDHGVESAEDRRAMEKPLEALLKLDLSIDEYNLTLLFEDDGRGIDVSRIKKKILEKALWTEERTKNATDEELLYCIFESGFSTTSSVSEISGRGVGMDMVKTSIEELNGEVSLRTKVGTGTQFCISIPLIKSVNIKQALVLDLGANVKVALMCEDVQEIADVKSLCLEGRLKTINGNSYLSCGEQQSRVLSLAYYFESLSGEEPNVDSAGGKELPIVVVVRYQNSVLSFFAKGVHSSEELLVKDLPRFGDSCFNKVAISGRHGLLILVDLPSIKKLIETPPEFRRSI